MNQQLKIAVIGGTGKAGKYLVKELINQNFQFNMLVRNPEHLQEISSEVTLVHGDAGDLNAIRSLLKECTAVISTLGMGIPNSEPNIFSRSTTNILQVMKEFGITRYIVITGLNVDVPNDTKGAKTKAATEWMKTNYPKSTADKQLEYTLLNESKMEWTLVRLPLIIQSEERSNVVMSLEDCPGEKISAADLAHFLIEQLKDKSYIRESSVHCERIEEESVSSYTRAH